MHENLHVLPDIIYDCQKNFPDRPSLKYRGGEKKEYIAVSYTELVNKVESLVGTFYKLGIKKGDKVGIIADNSYRWIMCDFGVLSLGAADVPRGSDSTNDEIEYILHHSDSSFCIVDNPALCDRLMPILQKNESINKVFLMYGSKNDLKTDYTGLEIYDFDSEIENGRKIYNENKDELTKIRTNITENDLATIIYTSGTTGTPKGVMLLHKNLMHQVHSLTTIMPCREHDRWLSVLPIWHVFERAVEYSGMATGAVMAYSKPSPRNLLPDMIEIKPSFMVSVPRIWEAVYSGIMNQVKKGSPSKLKLFNFFLKIALISMKQKRIILGRVPYFSKKHIIFTLPFAYIKALFVYLIYFLPNCLGQALVFSQIRKKIGGKLKFPISGGGALPQYIDDFFSAIKFNILEGYGLTETSPVISVRTVWHPVCSSVGKPYHDVQVMIGDQSFNKKANQHRKGILYVKGDLVMAGYYKEPEKTAEVLRDGWFNTGDLARISTKGYIQLLGRAKDTIVLIGGENIEPGPIEEKLKESDMIDQIMVVGQDKKTLGALIIPNKNELTEFAKKQGIEYSDYEQLMTNKEVIDEFESIIKSKISHHKGFKSFELVQAFALLPKPFEKGTEETNSLKLKRNIIAKKYKEIIDGMYH